MKRTRHFAALSFWYLTVLEPTENTMDLFIGSLRIWLSVVTIATICNSILRQLLPNIVDRFVDVIAELALN
ncbi:hypothetical protein [Motiliproteus sp. MSK22-1]|uniref:hypothetical protein n=1 Tax=Motiliproteus sp. MSK22-1 TaxID=1897630 RepID=UPI00117DF14C|nr:hypothetical protein [Motiliproteus sp. MSK22-1]